MAIKKVCCAAGCDDLAIEDGPRCLFHQHKTDEKVKRGRARAKLGEAAQAGALLYSLKAWKVGRKAHLDREPLCRDCAELGLIVEGREVDHIEPHRGDRKKFFDKSNWQTLCKPCHSRKTAREVLAPGVGK